MKTQNGTYKVKHLLLDHEDTATAYNGMVTVQGVRLTDENFQRMYKVLGKVKEPATLYDLKWFVNGVEKAVILRGKPYPVCIAAAKQLKASAAYAIGLLKPIRQQ